VLPQRSDGDAFVGVHFEHPEEEVVEDGLLLLAAEEVLGLDVLGEAEAALALGVDVVEDVDACVRGAVPLKGNSPKRR
jgi:hypothetical protein